MSAGQAGSHHCVAGDNDPPQGNASMGKFKVVIRTVLAKANFALVLAGAADFSTGYYWLVTFQEMQLVTLNIVMHCHNFAIMIPCCKIGYNETVGGSIWSGNQFH